MDLDLDDVLAELNELTEKDICDNGNITNEKTTQEGRVCPEPSELRISTLTVVGNINTTLNVIPFCNWLTLVPQWLDKCGPLMIDYYAPPEDDPTVNRKNYVLYRRGTCKKILMEMEKSSKPFQNAASIYYRHPRANSTVRKEPNIKIFENGGLQMTGIDDIETARIVFESIIQKMKDCHRENPELNILGDCNACHLRNFEVHMLNSDFDAGFIIHRENLSHILRERYHLICRYESTRQQGVNIKQMFNENNALRDGICHCGKMCDGGGSGYRERNGGKDTSASAATLCRQITIAPFQTGKVIITGAKSQEQLDEALAFITGVFRNHFGNLCAGFNENTRDNNKDKIHRSANKRILFINKDVIRYTGVEPPENIPEE